MTEKLLVMTTEKLHGIREFYRRGEMCSIAESVHGEAICDEIFAAMTEVDLDELLGEYERECTQLVCGNDDDGNQWSYWARNKPFSEWLLAHIKEGE